MWYAWKFVGLVIKNQFFSFLLHSDLPDSLIFSFLICHIDTSHGLCVIHIFWAQNVGFSLSLPVLLVTMTSISGFELVDRMSMLQVLWRIAAVTSSYCSFLNSPVISLKNLYFLNCLLWYYLPSWAVPHMSIFFFFFQKYCHQFCVWESCWNISGDSSSVVLRYAKDYLLSQQFSRYPLLLSYSHITLKDLLVIVK